MGLNLHAALSRTHRRLGPSRSAWLVRRSAQAACLIAFLALFFYVCWPYGSRQYAEAFHAREIVDAELFLFLDPLVSVSTAVAARMLVWSLPIAAGVIGLCLLLPRAFCGYVCPFGTLFDLFDGLLGRVVPVASTKREGCWTSARYYVLGVVMIAAVFGVLLSGFVAAMAVLTRAMLLIATPAQTGLLKGWHLIPPGNLGHAISILLVVLMFCLGLLGRRFWCRCVCPTGALLSLCSVLRLRERRVTDTCVKCGRCIEVCTFAAIRDDFSTRPLNCASCHACSAVCPMGAVEFAWRWRPVKRAPSGPEVVLSRRGVLAGLGGAAVIGVGVPLATRRASARREIPIRPPGSVPEDKFLQLCVRCGQCIKVCPNNVLQPAGFEHGFNGLWTPRVTADWSGCEPTCNNCGQVCPTGAVRALSLEEKRAARIGCAQVDRGTCLPHAGRDACQLCVDECRMAGYNAIEFIRVGGETDERGDPIEGSGRLAPVVRDDRCVGCGLCQMRCRAINVKSKGLLDRSAVRVVAGPGREDRIMHGSYIALRDERIKQQRGPQDRVEDGAGGIEYLPDFLK
ncbi:MAG: 4Fe-4S binding protein [Phycisphaerae bacterium]|nr:4Fe-4S binding protein [Phycisphaerae bacterium]